MEGMTCATCVNTIESLVAPVPGIKGISVNLMAKRAVVHHFSDLISPTEIADRISDIGYTAAVLRPPSAGSVSFLLGPIDKSLNLALDAAPSLETLPGVVSVFKRPHEDLTSSSIISVEFDPSVTSARQLMRHLRSFSQTTSVSLFKQLSSSVEALKRTEEIAYYRSRFIISLFFAIPVFVLGMLLMWIDPAKQAIMKVKIVGGVNISGLLQFLISTPAQFWLGAGFYRHAWIGLRNLRPTMDLLIALGTSAAYFYSVFVLVMQIANPMFEGDSFFEVAVILICFVLLGRFLENNGKGKSSDAILKLMKLQANTAIVVDFDESTKEITGDIDGEVVDTDLVQVGDVLRVPPGASIPVDGVVVLGNSNVNEAMISGESMPQKRSEGSSVIGGTMNMNSVLYVKATKVGADTALSKIVQLVEDAQAQKPEIQKMTDRLSGVFVPIVVAIAVIDFGIWMLVFRFATLPDHFIPETTSPFVFSLLLAISVLVIACPCGLGLAAPSAIMVGTGLAAKYHILIKGGLAIEKGHQVDVVLFDKTGTLTIGQPTVTIAKRLRAHSSSKKGSKGNHVLSKAEFLAILASAEMSSEHPIGKAIFSYAKDGFETLQGDRTQVWPCVVQPKRFKAISGRGITCKINKKRVLMGNRALFEEHAIDLDEHLEKRFQKLESEGKTLLLVGYAGQLVGYIAVADQLRPEAVEIAKQLRRRNIRMGIVSGDNERTVNHIAQALGVDDLVFSQVLPQDKKKIVERCQRERRHGSSSSSTVAFVGDGINDSPALAQADVGVAIGTGTDVAIEAASIVLMRSDLRDILVMIDIVRKTYNRIRWNLFFAFVYNGVGIPLAAGVLYPAVRVALPPWFAGLAMALSSVSVVVSSLLLRFYKPKSSRSVPALICET